ncbi:multisubunit Na+/H+ antiporter MnhF subunit [Wenyingzhuangia heitensis]|uniref:Multisubunit Na+/H+ antiporter MnhF subunit n=1 Tax=Wenyingzhuangia heitensis TaxID=1487859 RepID=A0ABX0U9Y0_9FLAO|nr:hypothetical protein [Wenyingzhuangia heitensis]NIJ45174.1 multisubunit Na+/H+ antiporter MnhF subunit [Wenyingzhuangia heitensis]
MIKQSQFSIYDFLGYIIPGSTLIYSYIIIEKINTDHFESIEKTLKDFGNINAEGIFIFIICSYIIGHLLSFLSSLTIEKYSNLKYNYPSKYLLEIGERSHYFKKITFKKGKITKDLKTNFWRLIIGILLLPIYTIDLVFNVKKNYTKSLDPFLRDQITLKIKRLLVKLKIEVSDFDLEKHDFHRIILHHSFEKNTSHQFKMINYVALYGFLRNISLTSIILFWVYTYTGLKNFDFNNPIDVKILTIVFILGFISFVSFVAFVKFYRRYTLEGLMLTLIDEEI